MVGASDSSKVKGPSGLCRICFNFTVFLAVVSSYIYQSDRQKFAVLYSMPLLPFLKTRVKPEALKAATLKFGNMCELTPC
jgi:hypothetical protein